MAEKPCRVCSEFKQWTKNTASKTKQKTGVADATARLSCPPDGGELGRATWTFLHTTAAYYPDQPSLAEQRYMSTLLKSISHLYPCDTCAEHLREEISHNPPDVSSRPLLEGWLCRTHNEVNERLGKPVFDCRRVRERWRDGPVNDTPCFEEAEVMLQRLKAEYGV